LGNRWRSKAADEGAELLANARQEACRELPDVVPSLLAEAGGGLPGQRLFHLPDRHSGVDGGLPQSLGHRDAVASIADGTGH